MANEKFFKRRNKKLRQEWEPHWILKLLMTCISVVLSLVKIAIGAAATVIMIVLICGVVFIGTLGDYLQEDILTAAADWSLEDYDLERTSFIHYVDNNGDIQLLQQIYTTTDRQWASVGWKMIFLSEMDEIQKGWKETTSFMLKLVIVFVIFAVCSVIYFHIRIYRPIQILTNTMNRVTKISCDLETPSGKDEIGQLGSAFKHLLERVSAQVVEIEAAERSKAELEIRALQAQITPHFLYNTLNAIKCLARLERTQDISAMVALNSVLKYLYCFKTFYGKASRITFQEVQSAF